GRTPVRAAQHLEAGWPRARPVDLRLDRATARRPHLAPLRHAGRDRVPVLVAGAIDMAMVFVIDDQASVRHALAEMLGVFGFAVETYDSATRFLQSLHKPRIGCVIADVRMPGIDGIELVREL